MNELISQKIKSARKLRGLSQQSLADQTGVTKQMVSKYEKGISVPSGPTLIQLAKSLNLNPDFFFSPTTIELETVNFRKKSKLSVKRLDAIKEEVKLKLSNYLEIENILEIDNIFEHPVQSTKRVSSSDIPAIVLKIREEWEIGLDPVHNIIQHLEDQKIKIIEIEENENLFDGLASIVDHQFGVIVINKNFPIERKRFTLLHELGHLILDAPYNKKEEENLCNQFASEFLLPQASLYREFGIKRNMISLKELITVQVKYGISIQAIFYRLNQEKIISEDHYKLFYKKINSDPDFKQEINQERFESPEFSQRYKQLVYRAFSEKLISASKTAALLNKNINEILDKKMV